jgi:hypothetical protein
MTTLDDVADVETDLVRKSGVERSTDTKAAVAYLIASGAVAISIVENETGCAFRIGTKIDPRAASVHWLPEAKARPVLKAARRGAGKSPDIATAISALHKTGADLKVTLTPHATAMMRASEAAKRLDQYMASLRGTGVLREFTKAYRRKRLAAGLRGEGFMSYGNAELRLRRALIPLLMNGGQPAVGQSLFAEIFGS